MAIRNAEAIWDGSLHEGQGMMRLGSGAFEGKYTYQSRFEEGGGTNPEELIAAAHAGCFSMALSAELGKAGYTPTQIRTRADVRMNKIGGNNTITEIDLVTHANVPGIDQNKFQEIAEAAKKGCPVSRALAAVQINLEAHLDR